MHSQIRYAITISIIMTALALNVPVVSAHPDPADHGGEHPDGPSFNETVLLFAGDSDPVTANASDWVAAGASQSFPPRTDYLYLALTTDIHQMRPLQDVISWNRHDYDDIPVSVNTNSHDGTGACPVGNENAGEYHHCNENPVTDWIDDPDENPLGQGRSVAVRPQGNPSTSGPRGWISDAHTSLFDITPSTRFQIGNGSVNYVGKSGTVRGFTDYRIKLPEGDQDPAPDRKVFYQYQSDSVQTCLLKLNSELPSNWENPCEEYAAIAQGSNSQRINISYTAPGQNTPQSRFILVGKITTTVTKVIEKKKTKTVQTCDQVEGPNGGIQTVCDTSTETYWDTTEETITSSAITSDARYINVYSPFTSLEVAHFPDGDHEVLITSQDPWLSLTLANNSQLYSNYRFFSMRDPAWDRFQITNNNGESKSVMSSAHPLQTNAYPYRSDGYGSDPGVQVIEINSGYNYTAPSLPAKVNLTQVEQGTEFQAAQTLLSSTDAFNTSHLQLTGLVSDSNVSNELLTAQLTENTVKEPHINVTKISSNSSFSRFRVLLTGPNGSAIETADRDGNITFGGQTLQTDSDGQAEITVPNDGLYTVEYNPAEWWKLGDDEQPYVGNSTTAVASGSLISFETLFALVWRSFLFLLPLLSLLWVADQIPGVKAWPPTFLIFWK